MPPAKVIGLCVGPFNIWCWLASKSSLNEEKGGGISKLRSHLPVLMLEVRLALGQLRGSGGCGENTGQLIQGLSQADGDNRHP